MSTHVRSSIYKASTDSWDHSEEPEINTKVPKVKGVTNTSSGRDHTEFRG